MVFLPQQRDLADMPADLVAEAALHRAHGLPDRALERGRVGGAVCLYHRLTDADEDGYQIRALLLAMLFKLLPSLVREGIVYIAETPLYEIKTKDETYFAYNEKEKAEILAKIGNAKYQINRSKGLGENDPDMMSRTTMHPSTRRLLQIKMEDEAKTIQMFDILMGDRVEPRKVYIEKYGAKFLPMADY